MPQVGDMLGCKVVGAKVVGTGVVGTWVVGAWVGMPVGVLGCRGQVWHLSAVGGVWGKCISPR